MIISVSGLISFIRLINAMSSLICFQTCSGVSAGVRRLEALTGKIARKTAEHQAQVAKTDRDVPKLTDMQLIELMAKKQPNR